MESSAPSLRSRTAEGGKKQQPSSQPAVPVRRSSRLHSDVEAGTSAPFGSRKASQRGKQSGEQKTEVEMWSVSGRGEPVKTYTQRITQKLREYDILGRKLKELEGDLAFTRYQVSHSGKTKKTVLSARVRELKEEIKEVEEMRSAIREGAGLFRDKLENEPRYDEIRKAESLGRPQQTREPSKPVKREEEEGEAIDSGGESQSEGEEVEMDVSAEDPQSFPIEAGQKSIVLPSSEAESDSEDGGLLREIEVQESPTRFENFTFGDDLGSDSSVKKRRRKKKEQEPHVSYVFTAFQQSEPAAKLVQAADPSNLPDPVSVVERGQHGGQNSMAKMAEDAAHAGVGSMCCVMVDEEVPDRMVQGQSDAAAQAGSVAVSSLPTEGSGAGVGRVAHVASVMKESPSPTAGSCGLEVGDGSHNGKVVPGRPGAVQAEAQHEMQSGSVVLGGSGHAPMGGGRGQGSSESAAVALPQRQMCSPSGKGSTSPDASDALLAGEEARGGGAGGPGAVGSARLDDSAGKCATAPASPRGTGLLQKGSSRGDAGVVGGASGSIKSKNIVLKPPTLVYSPRSSSVNGGVNVGGGSVNDGSDCVGMDGVVDGVIGGGIGPNQGQDAGVIGMNAGHARSPANERVDSGESVAGVSGPAAPPSAARSYASVAAGGPGMSMPGSLPSGPGGTGVLQQRLLEALRRGERTLTVEGREIDLAFWIERHGLGAFRERNGEVVWSLQTPGQEGGRRNVVRLVWRGSDVCPQRGKVVELLLKAGFRANDIFALIHPYGTSEFDISFVNPQGLETFWSNYELMKNEPGWRDFAVKAISRQNAVKKVTVLTRNESLSCYDIMTWLGKYGEVTDVPRKNMDEFGIWSGAWTFMVRLKRSGGTVAHIPSAAFLGRDRIQVFYQGQPKLCHRCGDPTHLSANCTKQICALCRGEGHLAATCGRVCCHLCDGFGHPFSRCPRSFSNAAIAPPGESREVASGGEESGKGEGAPVLVRKRHKPPSKLRREERRRRSRDLGSAQGVVLGPASDAGSGVHTEALEDTELNEEIGRLRREEGAADSSSPSQYESAGEDGGSWSAKKKKSSLKRRGRGAAKAQASSFGATDQRPGKEASVSLPLVSLSNKFESLGAEYHPLPDTDEEGQEDTGVPPGGTEPVSREGVSLGEQALPGPGGEEQGMDMSICLKRKDSLSDSAGQGKKGKSGAV